MRRRSVAVLGSFASIGVLGGCLFSYDEAKPGLFYENRLDVDVIVYLEGADMPFESSVKSGTTGGLGTDKCLGTAIVVETEDGNPVGRVEEPACPDWTLVINEDGSLDYAEQTLDRTDG